MSMVSSCTLWSLAGPEAPISFRNGARKQLMSINCEWTYGDGSARNHGIASAARLALAVADAGRFPVSTELRCLQRPDRHPPQPLPEMLEWCPLHRAPL